MRNYWRIPFAAGSTCDGGHQTQLKGLVHNEQGERPWLSPAGATRNRVKRLLVPMVMSMWMLAACSDTPKLPQPPLLFPFDTQKAGFKIETDMRVVSYNSFEFGFKLGFKEGDAADRARVKKLAGDYAQDKAGKLIQPGVPIAVRIRINALKPSALEEVYEREYFEERENAASATDFYVAFTELKLKPGTYHLSIENLKAVPELQGTTVTFYMATDPKSSMPSD